MYQSRLRQINSALKRDRKKQAEEAQKAAKLAGEADRLVREAERTGSSSIRSSKLRRAESKRKDATKAQERAAGAGKAVAGNESKLVDIQRKLADAEASRRRQQQQHDERERRRQEREYARREAERERQLQGITSRTGELEARLLKAQRKLAPPEITVLFLASSPEDLEPLRLDQETREIQQRLRTSEHRDSIKVEWRLARQLRDLMDDLNQTRPHVVHFSGHGNQREFAFEDADGDTKPLSNELLAQLLSVNSDRIRLAVFNSCQSAAQAQLACDHIELAIGMSTTVADAAAKTFAAQFYSSIGYGHSVEKAFAQAKTQVALEYGDGGHVPELFVAEGVDPATVVLVDPGAASELAAA